MKLWGASARVRIEHCVSVCVCLCVLREQNAQGKRLAATHSQQAWAIYPLFNLVTAALAADTDGCSLDSTLLCILQAATLQRAFQTNRFRKNSGKKLNEWYMSMHAVCASDVVRRMPSRLLSIFRARIQLQIANDRAAVCSANRMRYICYDGAANTPEGRKNTYEGRARRKIADKWIYIFDFIIKCVLAAKIVHGHGNFWDK